MFNVGQKVECINGDRANYHAEYDYVLPAKGQIYTIREITLSHRGNQYFRVNEIHQRPYVFAEGTIEPWFAALRFRPVVERKTDISTFTRMLTPEHVS